MKKLLLIAFMFVFAIVAPQLASAKGFSGGSSYSSKSSTYTGTSSSGTYKSSSSYSSPSTSGTYRSSGGFSGTSGTTSPNSSTTYHSGYKSPSSSVTNRSNSYNSNYYNNRPSTGRSIATHAAAFGAGALLGSMFHPIGGNYGGGYHGFSMLGFAIDIIGLIIIIFVVKAIFFRNRRY